MESNRTPAAPAALETELVLHLPALRRFARRLAGGDGDDLVQDACLAAAGARSSLRDLRGFLHAVVRRRRVDQLERMARTAPMELDADAHEPPVEEALERTELLRCVLEELETLPTAQRQAVTLRFVEECEVAEAARRLGVAPATVRAHTARGLAALRERLDRRFARRAAWAAPFLGRTSGPEVAQVRAEAASAKASGGVGPAALFVTVGLAVLAAGVLVLRTAPAPGVSEGAKREPDLAAFVGEGLEAPDGSTARIAAAPQEAAREDPNQAATDAGALVTFVDARTGETLPDLQVTLFEENETESAGLGGVGYARAAMEKDGAESPASDGPEPLAFEAPKGPVHVCRQRTDSEGRARLALPAEAVDADSATLLIHDARWVIAGPRRVALPLPATIPVEVGPTFHFAAGEERWTGQDARFYEGRTRIKSGEVRSGPGGPWVRFHPRVAELTGAGPFFVEVSNGRDTLGRAEVTRTFGAEGEPLEFARTAFGGVRFRVPGCGEGVAPIGVLRMERLDGAGTRRAEVIRPFAGENQEHTAAFIEVPVGSYRWWHGDAEGQVEVTRGRTAEVRLPALESGFDVELSLDLTAVGGMQRIGLLWAYSLTEPTDGYVVHDAEVEECAADDVRVRFRLPEGEWRMESWGPEGKRRWIQGQAVVARGNSALRLAVGAPPEVRTARLQVVDSADGKLLQGAHVRVIRRSPDTLRTHAGFTGDDDGGVSVLVESGSLGARVLVTAAGYRPRVIDLARVADDETLRVELEPGHVHPIHVRRFVDDEPVEGVEVLVDGRSAGVTDTDGIVSVLGDRVPLRVELRDASGVREVLADDLVGPLPRNARATGFTFLIR